MYVICIDVRIGDTWTYEYIVHKFKEVKQIDEK
jgi:hypothetical protein